MSVIRPSPRRAHTPQRTSTWVGVLSTQGHGPHSCMCTCRAATSLVHGPRTRPGAICPVLCPSNSTQYQNPRCSGQEASSSLAHTSSRPLQCRGPFSSRRGGVRSVSPPQGSQRPAGAWGRSVSGRSTAERRRRPFRYDYDYEQIPMCATTGAERGQQI